MKTLQRHPYRDDGSRDFRGLGRCVECLLPEVNERHILPDVSEQTAEHRRRVGEDEE